MACLQWWQDRRYSRLLHRSTPIQSFGSDEGPRATCHYQTPHREDIKVGDGDVVQQGATITAHYTGALAKDGTIFQSSHDFGNPATFGLHQVIAGWTEGVPGMKVGGTRRLIIPAAKAYAASSPSHNIPPNSDLVFDIELIAIKA